MNGNTTDITSTTGTTTTSRIEINFSNFLALPSELRNKIYEFAFTSGQNVDEPKSDFINLLDPHPPRKALLLTSHQIHNEAKGLYKSAYQAYWTTNPFLLHQPMPPWSTPLLLSPNPATSALLSYISPLDLQHILDIRIIQWPLASILPRVQQFRTNEELTTASPAPKQIWTFHGSAQWELVHFSTGTSAFQEQVVQSGGLLAPSPWGRRVVEMVQWATFVDWFGRPMFSSYRDYYLEEQRKRERGGGGGIGMEGQIGGILGLGRVFA